MNRFELCVVREDFQGLETIGFFSSLREIARYLRVSYGEAYRLATDNVFKPRSRTKQRYRIFDRCV